MLSYSIQAARGDFQDRRAVRVFMRYAHEFVIVVDVQAHSALPAQPPRAVPTLAVRHWRRVRERVPVQHQDCCSVNCCYHSHWNTISESFALKYQNQRTPAASPFFTNPAGTVDFAGIKSILCFNPRNNLSPKYNPKFQPNLFSSICVQVYLKNPSIILVRI